MSSVLPASTENATCLDVRQKKRQAESDLVSFAPTYASCYPQEAEGQQLQSIQNQINSYKAEKTTVFKNEMGIFETLLETLRLSNRTKQPVEAYVGDLQKERTALEQENYRLQQSIRAGRRRFLDDDPQGGVVNVGPFATTDDRIMLFFWITYAFFLVVGLFILFGLYGSQFGLETTKQKIGFGSTVFLLLFGIAYWVITRYA
jgi:hypothetical protein